MNYFPCRSCLIPDTYSILLITFNVSKTSKTKKGAGISQNPPKVKNMNSGGSDMRISSKLPIFRYLPLSGHLSFLKCTAKTGQVARMRSQVWDFIGVKLSCVLWYPLTRIKQRGVTITVGVQVVNRPQKRLKYSHVVAGDVLSLESRLYQH